MKATLFTIIFFVLGLSSYSQGDYQKILRRIQAFMMEKEAIGFNVRYYYAQETAPDATLDSLSGSYILQKGRSWCKVDEMEIISSKKYSISVFHDQKRIMVSPALQPMDQFLRMLDSLAAHSAEIGIKDNRPGHLEIEANLAGQGAESCEIEYDTKTYHLLSLRYRLPAALMGQLGGDGGRVLLTLKFFDYNEKPEVDRELFNPGKYIHRQGEEYIPDAAYSGYEVFVSSPSLLN